jgi:hypothetical protein
LFVNIPLRLFIGRLKVIARTTGFEVNNLLRHDIESRYQMRWDKSGTWFFVNNVILWLCHTVSGEEPTKWFLWLAEGRAIIAAAS